ncbi:hypothetical protein AB9K36_32475 [Klebsiella michiganensis]
MQAAEIFWVWEWWSSAGYRILNALIAEAEKEEKACEKQPEEHQLRQQSRRRWLLLLDSGRHWGTGGHA